MSSSFAATENPPAAAGSTPVATNNSRGSDEDELVRRVCALAGFEPRIARRVDSLRLVNSLVGAGLGIALLADIGRQPEREDVVYRPLDPLASRRRSFLVVRAGQWSWPPIAALAAEISAEAEGDA